MFQANESNGTLNGTAEVIAILSNPSYTNTTVQVMSDDITASKLHIYILYMSKYVCAYISTCMCIYMYKL